MQLHDKLQILDDYLALHDASSLASRLMLLIRAKFYHEHDLYENTVVYANRDDKFIDACMDCIMPFLHAPPHHEPHSCICVLLDSSILILGDSLVKTMTTDYRVVNHGILVFNELVKHGYIAL